MEIVVLFNSGSMTNPTSETNMACAELDPDQQAEAVFLAPHHTDFRTEAVRTTSLNLNPETGFPVSNI